MSYLSSNIATLAVVCVASFSASAFAATPKDCQRAIDEVSVKGRANYDSATEAQMTKYLNAANVALMQKNGGAQALKELKSYEQSLNGAMTAQKINQDNGAVLKDKLNKAIQCVSGLK